MQYKYSSNNVILHYGRLYYMISSQGTHVPGFTLSLSGYDMAEYVYIYIYIHTYMYMHMYMYVCMYVCMYMYMYIYIYIYK